MMPTTLFGSQIGAQILQLLPSILVATLLFILLIALTIQAFCKARQISATENAAKVKPTENEEVIDKSHLFQFNPSEVDNQLSANSSLIE